MTAKRAPALSPGETTRRRFFYRGSSMQGTFRPGDLLLIKPVSLDMLRPGDVVAFRRTLSDGRIVPVAHRVVARTDAGLVTRADSAKSPDVELVAAEEVIGRVRLVQRGERKRPVLGGPAGLLWLLYLRLRRRIVSLVHRPYVLLQTSGLVRCVWHPRLTQIYLTSTDGPLVKYVHGQRTVACWWPEQGRFWCRRPYDLVIEPPENKT